MSDRQCWSEVRRKFVTLVEMTKIDLTIDACTIAGAFMPIKNESNLKNPQLKVLRISRVT